MLTLCHSSTPFSPPPQKTAAEAVITTTVTTTTNWFSKTILKKTLSTAVSLNLLLSSPSLLALPQQQQQPPPQSLPLSSATEIPYCHEDEIAELGQSVTKSVTNEGLVEEAWQIVNDSFLDPSSRRRWSAELWKQKREDVLSSSIRTRSKAHDVIRRMLASLGDPYTRFLPPSEFSKMARYDMTGIGTNLREVPDGNGGVKLKVLGILLDGPAHSAGVRQGDEILAVNGEDVRGKTAFEVSSLLQGPNETFVTVEVKHGNCGPIQSIEVQRQLVARTPVFYRLEQIENDATAIGYIQLKEFNALARKDLVIAMKRLQDMGASYFVLDLRDNLGGLVQAGIEIARLFLHEGETVVNTVGRDIQYQNTIVADSAPLISAPVVVLVNKKTASASEIVASSLHDNCRAVLVGERTFGKGLIQSVFELDDGSGVVVTVGKYVTPNHMDINGTGIEPDYQKLPAWNEVRNHLSRCSIMHHRG